MANISVEAKGPKGIHAKESLLPTAVAGYTRGLAVVYGADAYTALLAGAAAPALGLIEEDAIDVGNPVSVITLGETVAQLGAAGISKNDLLTTNAAGQLVVAQPGQPVVAVAMEDDPGPGAGDYICVFVLGRFGFTLPGDTVVHAVAAGAIAVQSGAVGLGGAAALAMTLALPTNAQDGTIIFVTAESSEAHTVTTPANGINGAKHTVTFAARGDGVELEAVGGVWNVRSLVGGAVLA